MRYEKTHGESKPVTPEYTAWSAMKQRRLCRTHKSYPSYGGRGISICDRWMQYENFLHDMGRRPSPDHSLERVDNDRGYEPSNCKWATRSEQQQNKSVGIRMNTNTSGVTGVSWYSQTSRWEAYHWVKNRKIRLGYFEQYEDAVSARKAWEKSKKEKKNVQ